MQIQDDIKKLIAEHVNSPRYIYLNSIIPQDLRDNPNKVDNLSHQELDEYYNKIKGDLTKEELRHDKSLGSVEINIINKYEGLIINIDELYKKKLVQDEEIENSSSVKHQRSKVPLKFRTFVAQYNSPQKSESTLNPENLTNIVESNSQISLHGLVEEDSVQSASAKVQSKQPTKEEADINPQECSCIVM